MHILLVSGLSGAGKSTAARYLEDMGYFCIDNVPPFLLEVIVPALSQAYNGEDEKRKLCFITDVRSMSSESSMVQQVQELLDTSSEVRLLFLEAKTDVLLSRYKQSRRNHPLAKEDSLLNAIKKEQELLISLREVATDIIDTSFLSGPELRDLLLNLYGDPAQSELMNIYLQSFGYKYGLPLDADIVLDLRFIPNPFYLPELRQQNGCDQAVQDYIFSFPESEVYFQKILDNLTFLLPYYEKEGKMRLNIAVGCTGGHHRSVAFVERLAQALRSSDHLVFKEHRDIENSAEGGL